MRSRSIPPTPAVLDGPTSKGGVETATAITYYEADPPPDKSFKCTNKSFKFKMYGDKAVRDALTTAFDGKCAYCESVYAHLHPVDVEHYRPKNEVITGTGDKLPTGYYWLAATWDNLLPSCIDCNRTRGQTHHLQSKAQKSGKGSKFPLLDEDRRVLVSTGDVDDEDPVLLHPYKVDPARHIELGEEGEIRATEDPAAPGGEDERGRGTIDLLGLNRVRLVQERQKQRTRLATQMERIRMFEETIREVGPHPRLQKQLKFEIAQLKLLRASDEPYLALTEPMIAAFKAERGL